VIKVALRGMAGRKLRAFLTALAIVLGVAMMSGAYVLTDTIDKAFDTIFVDSYAGTDVVITGKEPGISFEGESAQGPPIPEETLEQVREVDGVEVATGSVQDFQTKLIKADGDAVDTGGAPAFAFGIETAPEYDRFNPLNLVEGRWPDGAGEVAVDEGVADDENLAVGDSIGVAAIGRAERFEIVGIAKYGDLSSIGGATFAIFDIPTAQELLDKEGQLDSVQAAAVDGVTPEELTQRIEAELGADFTVRTGVEQADEDSGEIATFTNIIRYFLLSFAGIALFVGAFVIFNTLSITVAQRTREFATLRTIGASRRQVLTSVIVEALVIGLVASIIGLFSGLGLAVGLNELFVALNLDLPQTETVFATRTIVVSLLVGTLVTLVAGLFPAIRATRVPPIAAVREGATLPRGRFARFTPYIAVVIVALAVLALAYGTLADDIATGDRFALLGLGVLFLFIGVAMLSSRLVRPLVSLIGPVAGPLMRGLELLFFPVTLGYSLLGRAVFGAGISAGRRVGSWALALVLFLASAGVGVLLFMAGQALPAVLGAIPVAIGVAAVILAGVGVLGCTIGLPVLLIVRAFRGSRVAEPAAVETDLTTQQLGKENSRRNPGRTAATAAALMIGIALVTFVAVLAQGLRTSNSDAIERQIQSDLIVTSQDGYSEFPSAVGDAVEDATFAETVSNVRQDIAEIEGSGANLTGLDENITAVYDLRWEEGSDELVTQLGDDGAVIPNNVAEDKNLAVGDTLTVLSTDNRTKEFVVRGIYEGSPFYPLLGTASVSKEAFDELYDRPRNRFTLVNVPGAPTEASQAELEATLDGFPDTRVFTRQGWIDKEDEEIGQFLTLLYVLLALSVIISLFGMVNTLALSVFERTRELGMLRAVGMTRRQVKRMIRHESVITALIGAALGLPLGIFLALLVTNALSQYDLQFAIPTSSLIAFVIVAIVAGFLAAVLPARRASRLRVLEALQYE
jgi:ABC-type antimicrobial peptide transport system permease subunit